MKDLTKEEIEVVRDVLISYWAGGGHSPEVPNMLCDMALQSLPNELTREELEPMTLMGEKLIDYAHKMRIEACSAWSAVMINGVIDETKCQYAAAMERRLEGVINEIYALRALASPGAKDADEA